MLLHLGGDDPSVRLSFHLRRHQAHDFAHGLHAESSRASGFDGGGNDGPDLLGAHLFGKVAGKDDRFVAFLLSEFGTIARGEGLGRFASFLGLGAKDGDHLVVGQFPCHLAGYFGRRDGGEHHTDYRGAQGITRLDRGGQVGTELFLEG